MKTIRVRIAVAVDTHGKAVAAGAAMRKKGYDNPEQLLEDWAMLEGWSPEEKLAYCWVEADVPVPEAVVSPTIEGTVTP